MDLPFISDLNMDSLYIAFIINNHDTGDDNDDQTLSFCKIYKLYYLYKCFEIFDLSLYNGMKSDRPGEY